MPHVKIEPEIKPLLITQKGFNGANNSMDEIDIKEEPLHEELVSKFYDMNFHNFGLNEINTNFFLFTQLAMLYSVQG